MNCMEACRSFLIIALPKLAIRLIAEVVLLSNRFTDALLCECNLIIFCTRLFTNAVQFVAFNMFLILV